jgi:hypothetical protein
MNVMKASAGVVLMAGLLSAGCQNDSSASARASKPMTSPPPAESSVTMRMTKTPPAANTPAPPRTAAPAPAPAPTVAETTTPVPEKDLTHVLSQDEPYYASSPAQGRPADGTLKAGTKVLVMMPRGSYSQVVTADGKRVYTSTAGLKPIGS